METPPNSHGRLLLLICPPHMDPLLLLPVCVMCSTVSPTRSSSLSIRCHCHVVVPFVMRTQFLFSPPPLLLVPLLLHHQRGSNRQSRLCHCRKGVRSGIVRWCAVPSFGELLPVVPPTGTRTVGRLSVGRCFLRFRILLLLQLQ